LVKLALLAALAGMASAVAPTAGASSASDAARTTGSLSAALRTKIDALVQQEMTESNVPGVAIGVWRNGRKYVHAFGVADIATGKPFDAGDRVRIASITKTFTGTAVLRLVDQKKLSLDDRLSEYVDGVPNGDEITVRQLLDMTAGVYDYTMDDQFNAALTADPTIAFTTADLMAILARHEPAFAPGTSWSYSDSNYALLGLVIEEVTGKPAGTVITELTVDPLGLHGTSYPTTTAIPDPHPVGYLFAPPGTALRDVTPLNPGIAGPAGAMISTLPDLRVWAREVADGSLLRPATQRARLDLVDTKLSQALDVGYGLGVFGINGFLGHNGAIYGYNTAAFSLPNRDATIVVVSNASTNFEGIGLDTFVKMAQLTFPKQFAKSN
jgi:D-alanyl-D-alanine carboxypeptidase